MPTFWIKEFTKGYSSSYRVNLTENSNWTFKLSFYSVNKCHRFSLFKKKWWSAWDFSKERRVDWQKADLGLGLRLTSLTDSLKPKTDIFNSGITWSEFNSFISVWYDSHPFLTTPFFEGRDELWLKLSRRDLIQIFSPMPPSLPV